MEEEEEARVLQQHGLTVAARVSEEAMEAFARSRGARAVAVVADDGRLRHVSAMLAELQVLHPCCTSRLVARETPADGLALFVSQDAGGVGEGARVNLGDELLVVALARCISMQDINTAELSLVQQHIQRLADAGCLEDDDVPAACVRLALLHLLEHLPADPRVLYWTHVCPPEHFASTHMACWHDRSPAARLVAHSVSWRRARAWRTAMLAQHCVLARAAALVVPAETFVWAALVVQTRAIVDHEHGPILCPGVDAANHHSVNPAARVEVSGGAVRLVANGALDAGKEVRGSKRWRLGGVAWL